MKETFFDIFRKAMSQVFAVFFNNLNCILQWKEEGLLNKNPVW